MTKSNVYQVAEDRLKKEGYKLTNQRKAILRAFEDSESHLLSAQQLFTKVVALCPGTNFSTIYRNLELLTNLSILNRVELGDGIGNYELRLGKEHHHHLICMKCGDTQVIEFCPLSHLKDNEVYTEGFTPVNHRFDIYGYCNQCNEKVNGEE